MALGSRVDPYRGFNFLVEIDQIIAAGFSEISGISAETKYDEYREGGNNDFVHRFPKSTEYPNLILKRGLSDSDILWNWYRQVVTGSYKRKNISVILMDELSREKWRWNFFQAYPVKWSGPELKADSSAVALETLEIVHNGVVKG